MTHADEIKTIRASLGMTQAAFASQLGVTWRSVAYWESGKRNPKATILILARKLKSPRK